MSPIILVGAGILLFGLGLGLGYWFSHRREATKAGDIQSELDEYRRHVTEHFSETAQHFQAVGQQYRSLYKHMAQGAEALCDTAQAGGMLEFPAGDTAALTADSDNRGDAPEPIRDYAPEEENEPVQVEVTAEEPETPESLADTSAAEQTALESDAKEELADAISQPTSAESERTVH